MQQRIGVARALAIDPEILLMDEPFSALDAQTRESLQHELLNIHAKTRKTILFVTHDLDEAVYLSDRVIVMGSRPGHVKDIIEVRFARPRPSLPEMRGNAQFLELRDHIWQRIRKKRRTCDEHGHRHDVDAARGISGNDRTGRHVRAPKAALRHHPHLCDRDRDRVFWEFSAAN